MSSNLFRYLSFQLLVPGSSPRRYQCGTRVLLPILFVVTSLCGFGPGARDAQAAGIIFSLDTNALSGTDARLDFQLIDGDVTDNSNVIIADITTDGTLLTTDCTVNCSGGPPPFTITDTGGLGLFAQILTLGSSLSFSLTPTLGGLDLLIVNLLNPDTNFSLVATDLNNAAGPVPYQDALLVLNLSNGSFQLPSSIDPTLSISAGPEPSTLILALFGCSLLLWKKIQPQLAAEKGKLIAN